MTDTDTSAATDCPHRSYNPALPHELIDPYPTLALLRAQTPVFWNDLMQCYVLTRHADVTAVLKDPETFSSRDVLFSGEVPAEVRDRMPDGYPYELPSLINSDPPHHSRIRKIALSVISPKRVASMRQLIVDLVNDMVAALPRSQQFDLMSALAVPLPVTVICRTLGFPQSDIDQLKAWSDDVGAAVGNPPIDPATRLQIAKNVADLQDYLLAQIASRRSQRGADLISAFVWAGADDPQGPMSDDEIVSVCCQLLVAGNETTTNLIGNMMYLLLRHPDQWSDVCADESLRVPAVEEALRLMTPLKALFRTTTREVAVGNVRLEADRRVLVLYAAANHDPVVFSEPQRFDIARTGANRHLAFGIGEHFCIGAPLARLEARCTLDALCRFADRLQLAGEPQFAHLMAGHGFTELPMMLAEDR